MGFDVMARRGGKVRYSIHTWPSITGAIQASGYDMSERWHNNDGAGLDSQKKCDKLADKLQALLDDGTIVMVPMVTKLGAATEAYVNTLTEEDMENLKSKNSGNAKWMQGKASNVITITPEDIPEHIRSKAGKTILDKPMDTGVVSEFICFLRGCRGFEIW